MISKLIWILYVWLVGVALVSSSVFGQSDPTSYANWRVFKPKADVFSVEVPVALTSDGKDDLKSSRMYYGQAGGTYFYVFSDPINEPTKMRAVSRFAASAGHAYSIGKDGTGTANLKFKDSDGFWHLIIGVRVGLRIFTLQTFSLLEQDDAANHFASSFKVADMAVAKLINTPSTSKPSSDPITNKLEEPGSDSKAGDGTGRGGTFVAGSGNGSGQGSGSATSTNSLPVTKRPIRVPMKLIKRPSAEYTAFARVYWITGSVRCRVTFLASGEIGSVSIVEGLPFGLNSSAIAAAKAMKFEPATDDGIPISMTRTVEYHFYLY